MMHAGQLRTMSELYRMRLLIQVRPSLSCEQWSMQSTSGFHWILSRDKQNMRLELPKLTWQLGWPLTSEVWRRCIA
jgi:hypothetical protein